MITMLASAAASPPFNGDIDTVAATVIPVLYLALSVQLSSSAGLMRRLARAWARAATARGHLAGLAATMLAIFLAVLFFAFTFTGELVALEELVGKVAHPGDAGFLAAVVLALLAVVMAGPFYSLVVASMPEDEESDKQVDPKPGAESGETDPSPHGKTDTA